MKKIVRFATLLSVIALMVTSCGKHSPQYIKYIPKDATLVFGVNSNSLKEKLGKYKPLLDSLTRALAESGSDSLFKKWSDFKTAGIDTSAEFFGFVKSGGSIMAGQSTSVGFVAPLIDADAFQAFLKKQLPVGEVKTTDAYSYEALGEGFVAGWTKNVVIIANVFGGSNQPGTYNTGEGTLAQQLITKLFAQTESESVGSLEPFNTLTKEQADAILFVNSANYPGLAVLNMTKLSDLFTESYVTATLNFEDGRIAANVTSYPNKALTGLLKKYPFHAISTDFLLKYPSSQIDGFASYYTNPKFVVELVKFAGADGVANQGLTSAGFDFTIDDIAKAFNGDFNVVLSDFSMQSKTVDHIGAYKLPQPVVSNQPSYKYILSTGIGDKEMFNKIVTELVAKGGLVGENGNYSVPNDASVVIKVAGNTLFVSSDATVLQGYLSGTAKADISPDVKDNIKDKSAAFYVDINKILLAVPEDSSTKEIMQGAKATFKDMIATGDVFDGTSAKGSFELRTMNENENSLFTMCKFFINIAKIEKARRVSMGEMQAPLTDSAAVMAPAK